MTLTDLDRPQQPAGPAARRPVLRPERVAQLASLLRASTDERATLASPLDGSVIGELPQSGAADVDDAFSRARAAQATWARTPMRRRTELMLRYHDLVLERRDELADLVVLETGKARKHAMDEVLHVALTARYYARTSARHLRTQRRAGVVRGVTRVDVRQVPKGVVGIISPWNYPLTMAVSDGLPALMAGNAVVAKPDGQTMLTALAAVELLREAGFPPELWQVVAGPGPVVGPEIIARCDYLCFTGSTATGTLLAQQCAARLVGCSLELGGKNPMLVLRDADLDRAAEGAVRASFSSAGQLCVSMERMYVDDAVYDDFVARFVAQTEAMRVGDPGSWDSDMGSLISARQLETVTAHVDDAVAKGARVLAGGRARPDLGPYFYEPTILAGVTPSMTCFGTETFGPVISLYRFSTEDEAVELANSGDYGLNASVYGGDAAHARAVAGRIKTGTVNVNEAFAATFASIDGPMGGMRQSGMGRRQGAEGILRYTETQTLATQRLVPMRPVAGMGARQYAEALFAHEKLMRILRSK